MGSPINPDGSLSRIELRLTFKARHSWYLVLWDTLRHQVVDGMASAFSTRHKALMQAQAQSHFVSEARPRDVTEFPGDTLQQILDGPFKGDLPVVITEKDGRTLRYVNDAFVNLTGYEKEEAEGEFINNLLQGRDTS